MALDHKELRAVIRTATVTAAVGAGLAAQLGDTIANGKVRKIYFINIANADAAAQDLVFYAGDALDADRVPLMPFTVPADDSKTLGGSIRDPILIVRPDQSVTPTQQNELRVGQVAGAGAQVTVGYYDEEA